MTIFPASCAECCPSQLQTPQLSIPVQQGALETTVLVLIGEKRSVKWVDGKQMVIYPLWLQFKSNTLNFVYSSNFFVPFLFFPAHLPQKLDRDRFCPSLGGTTLSTMVVWMWGGGDRWVQPYLQRSSCVESRTFFLFLLLPWWCGLFWWVLLLEELCCPWLPLFWWDRDVLACREGKPRKECSKLSFDIQHNTLLAGKKNKLICFAVFLAITVSLSIIWLHFKLFVWSDK